MILVIRYPEGLVPQRVPVRYPLIVQGRTLGDLLMTF